MVQAANQMADPATVVIDNGTGYTKMGYAGNMEPSYLIPSVIAKAVVKVSKIWPLILLDVRYFASFSLIDK